MSISSASSWIDPAFNISNSTGSVIARIEPSENETNYVNFQNLNILILILSSSELKVRQSQNDFFKPTFLPKNERTRIL